jgi:hypothetical protein
LDRKLSDSECRPNSPWKRTGAGRVFMENLQGLPIARRVIREQEVPPSSDVDGQGAAGIKPCRCRPILGQGRTKIFTVGIRHSLLYESLSFAPDAVRTLPQPKPHVGCGEVRTASYWPKLPHQTTSYATQPVRYYSD